MPWTGITSVGGRGREWERFDSHLCNDPVLQRHLKADTLRCRRFSSPAMDATDRRIVALLRENARRSFQDIGTARPPVRAGGQAPRRPARARRRGARLHRDRRPGGVRLARRGVRRPVLRGQHAGRGDQAGRPARAGVVSAHTVAGEASALLHVMAAGHQGPRAGARAHPRHRGRDPHRDRGRPLDPVHAMRRPFPDGRPPSIRDFMAFEEHVRNARAQPRLRGAGRLVRDPGLLLHQPRRGVRRRRRHPQAARHPDARLRARAGLRDRRRRPARGLHDHERLLRPRPAGARDAGRPRAGQGQGLRHRAGPGPGLARRAARRPGHARHRARQRRGAHRLPHRRHALLLGRAARRPRRATRRA